jgi:hypothetical protein
MDMVISILSLKFPFDSREQVLGELDIEFQIIYIFKI